MSVHLKVVDEENDHVAACNNGLSAADCKTTLKHHEVTCASCKKLLDKGAIVNPYTGKEWQDGSEVPGIIAAE